MARHRLLPVAAAVQERTLGQEARRGPALLPRQAARGGRLCAFSGDPGQGAFKQITEQARDGAQRVRECGSSCWLNGTAQMVDTRVQILDEHRRQGAEDQAFEKRVEKNKAAARKKAVRRCT